jgi:hypothetical protein
VDIDAGQPAKEKNTRVKHRSGRKPYVEMTFALVSRKASACAARLPWRSM